MRKLITIIAILFVGSTYGQTAMSRTIEVKDGQMSKFIEMAGKKTKMYNVMEIYFTFQGEGAFSGRPSVFCRFSGCNLWSGKEKDRKNGEIH